MNCGYVGGFKMISESVRFYALQNFEVYEVGNTHITFCIILNGFILFDVSVCRLISKVPLLAFSRFQKWLENFHL